MAGHALRGAAVALGLAAAVALGAVPAGAAPVDSGRFEFEDTFVFEDCGRPLESHERFTGSFMIKAAQPRTGGEFFRLLQRVEADITVRDPESGAFFTIEWSTTLSELPGSLVPGTQTRFVYRTVEAGVWDLWRDSTGRVVHRSTGAVVFEYDFDSLGDGMPGGEFVDVRLVRLAGNLPTFDADFCQLALPLLD
jgi:hypothetical protein